MAKPQKVYQQREPACPVKEKVQEEERRLRRTEEEETVHMTDIRGPLTHDSGARCLPT